MPGNHPLFSTQGLAEMFGVAAVALLGALVRVCFAPGKTPRQSVAVFGGCLAFGLLLGAAFRNSKTEWIHDAMDLICGFGAMIGPEIFKMALHTIPAIFRTILQSWAAKASKTDDPA